LPWKHVLKSFADVAPTTLGDVSVAFFVFSNEAKIEKRGQVHLERLAYDIVLLGTCATHAYTPGLNGVHHVQKDWKVVVKRPLNSEEHVVRPLLRNTRVIERECCVFLL